MVRKGFLVLLVTIFFAMVGAGSALAYTSSIYEKGCVVPYAFYDGAGMDTVVGVQIADPSLGGAIYWSFFDADGEAIASQTITVDAGVSQYGITLSGTLGGVGQNQAGWVLVTWDDDGIFNPGEAAHNVTANSFLIDLVNNDAAVIPVVPLNDGDYQAVVINLLSPPDVPLISMVYGQLPPTLDYVSRFLIDPSGDPETMLVVFSPTVAPADYTAQMISAAGTVQPGITLTTTHDNLNIFNLQDVAPAGFTDGAIEVRIVPPDWIGIQFSMIYWSTVGALQTSVAFER